MKICNGSWWDNTTGCENHIYDTLHPLSYGTQLGFRIIKIR